MIPGRLNRGVEVSGLAVGRLREENAVMTDEMTETMNHNSVTDSMTKPVRDTSIGEGVAANNS